MNRVRFRSPVLLLLAGLSSACALTRVADEAAEKPLRLGTGVYVGHSSARGGDAAAGAAGTLASRVEARAHRIDTDGTLVDPTTNLGLSYSDDITLEQLLIGISLVR